MSNKETLLEAISHFDVFTIKQRAILKILISVEIDYVAKITVKSLSEFSNQCAASIIRTLRLLKKEGLIEVDETERKFYMFKLNKEKLEEILAIHELKKKFCK